LAESGVQLCFENQVLDLSRRELLRDGKTIAVEPKTFDLLVCLVENRDRLVTKDDLIAKVWAGRIVSDSALASAINAARKAVGDSGQEQRLIRTAARKGIRFVGSVKVAARIDDTAPDIPSSLGRQATSRVHSILVLPFAYANGDVSQQALAEAITDDLTHDLSRIPGTWVIAHGTASTLRGQPVDARAVAKEFAVRYVVDGSVRIADDRIRINVQLVDAEGGHVWSDRIDAPRADLSHLQNNVSGRIAWALELELPSIESQRGQGGNGHSPGNFELSMLGWSLMNRAPSRGNVLAAEQCFRRAYGLEPLSVSTRIGLSFTHVRKVVSYWSDAPQEDLARANELIEPALTEAPRHDRGHFVKGLILRTELQLESSSAFFERAVQLNPNYAQAIAFLGFNRTLVGQPEQSFELFERAIQLSPRDPQIGVWLGMRSVAHLQLQQYDRAVEVSKQAVAANPEYGIAHLHLARASALAGRDEEAKVALANTMRLLPSLSVRMFRDQVMSRHPDYVAAWERGLAALRSIGLPD
jgi:TolB-like protein